MSGAPDQSTAVPNAVRGAGEVMARIQEIVRRNVVAEDRSLLDLDLLRGLHEQAWAAQKCVQGMANAICAGLDVQNKESKDYRLMNALCQAIVVEQMARDGLLRQGLCFSGDMAVASVQAWVLHGADRPPPADSSPLSGIAKLIEETSDGQQVDAALNTRLGLACRVLPVLYLWQAIEQAADDVRESLGWTGTLVPPKSEQSASMVGLVEAVA